MHWWKRPVTVVGSRGGRRRIVSLIKPSGALDVRTTLCVELTGNTYGDYDASQDSGSPDWSSTLPPRTPQERTIRQRDDS
ncbi:hypothetical protein ABZ612_21740 [Streptomyces avermitilis]|uniref:hypothetical protein n=1 Tax=Streptomyces avermitilis TaxID=33903 RepID=UPI0033F15992